MNDSTIAFRAKEQLGKFLGKVFTHFSKPKRKFLGDMLYGIQAFGGTMLSSVMRAINDDSDMRHAVEKRLSRNVADEKIGEDIDSAILAEGAKHVRDDTLILVDPTEIRKEYGLHMVVVKGFGSEPMMILTSLPVNGSFESMWRIVEGYLTRWRIEDTIRFVKQSYGFENIERKREAQTALRSGSESHADRSQPSRPAKQRPFHLWKSTSPLFHRGEVNFRSEKNG